MTLKEVNMRVAIHQPNFAPWCGYFTKMRHCDVFVFLDDAEMSKGSYIPRCRIMMNGQIGWLSVPSSWKAGDFISSVRISKGNWARKHLATIHQLYAKCPYYDEVLSIIEPVFQEPGELLADFNIRLIEVIVKYLGIECRFERSSDLNPVGTADDRLVSLTRIVGGDVYVSGKGGQNYQNPEKFECAGIKLEVREYKPISYAQGHGDFVPGLSILDALFHLGSASVRLLSYM